MSTFTWKTVYVFGKGVVTYREDADGRTMVPHVVELASGTIDSLQEQIHGLDWVSKPEISAEAEFSGYGDDVVYSRLLATGVRYATSKEAEEIEDAVYAEAERQKAAKGEQEARERAELARLKALYPE